MMRARTAIRPAIRTLLRSAFVRGTAALVALAVLGGCSAICGVDASGRVSLEAVADANGFRATAIDLVAATNAAASQRLSTLSGPDYFIARPQLLRDFPDQILVRSWELAPGQSTGPDQVSFPCGVDGLFVFGSLSAPGAHRLRLPSLGTASIRITAQTFEVSQ